MKLNKSANLLVIGLVLSLAASGCRKKPVGLTPLPGAPAGNVGEPGPGGPITPTQPLNTQPGPMGTPTEHESNPASLHQGWKENPEALKAETVYFDLRQLRY